MSPGNGKNKVWIDLDNSPHVPFFKPIIRRLREKNVQVFVTARQCYQVLDLLKKFQVQAEVIGRHYGKNKAMKVLGTFYRAGQLGRRILSERPDCAVSHGSRSQIVSAKLLGIPSILIMDYEHAQKIPFFNATLTLVPKVVADVLNPNRRNQIKGYPGFKENVYVPDFQPDENIRKELGLENDKIIVTVRPPATRAHYYCKESGILFESVMEFLCKSDGIQVVILPRDSEQSKWIESRWAHTYPEKLIIPKKAVDGLSLIWNSDLVISGGGTMNREAAALDVPVYSIFRGKLGAVDEYLSRISKLYLVDNGNDLSASIRLVRRNKCTGTPSQETKTVEFIVNEIKQMCELIDPNEF